MHACTLVLGLGHVQVLGAVFSLLKFQDFLIQVKSLWIAALVAERVGKPAHCGRIEVPIQARGVHLRFSNSHLKRANERLFARWTSMARVLAVLVCLHNAGHVYKPACTSIHAAACEGTHAQVPGAATTSTPSEQGAIALETYPATRFLAFFAVTARPLRFTHRACCACRGG